MKNVAIFTFVFITAPCPSFCIKQGTFCNKNELTSWNRIFKTYYVFRWIYLKIHIVYRKNY